MDRRFKKLVFFILISINCFAQNIYVFDGDTFKYNGIRYRLEGIDAPEISQQFGYESKQELSNLLKLGKLNIVAKTTDRYGRIIATIYANNQNINKEMVKRGFAWAYTRYSLKYTIYEDIARQNKVGMWVFNNNIQPEKFRRL